MNKATPKAVRLCRRLIVTKNAANDGGDLDLLSSLAPPDIDGDVASAYADAGGRFDVRRIFFFFYLLRLKREREGEKEKTSSPEMKLTSLFSSFCSL